MESFFTLNPGVPGCLKAFVKLRCARCRTRDWFTYWSDTEPPGTGYNRSMTADNFLHRVNPVDGTHALCIVLAGRLLWPDEGAKFHKFVMRHFKRSDIGGLENQDIFAKVWGLKRDEEAEGEFKKGILDRMHIMAQPVLRDVLPSLMNGAQVASYQLSKDLLTFSLDTVKHLKDRVEHSLDLSTGNITSSKGEGIIHRMFLVKRFFENEGNINGMADMVAEMGIASKM